MLITGMPRNATHSNIAPNEFGTRWKSNKIMSCAKTVRIIWRKHAIKKLSDSRKIE